MVKIKKVNLDDFMALYLALWIQSFNVLFFTFYGLSSLQLQALVLSSCPILFILLIKNKKLYNYDVNFLYLMVFFISFVLATTIYNHEVEILIRLLNFTYLVILSFFYLVSVKNGLFKLLFWYSTIGFFVLLLIIKGVNGIEFRTELEISPNYIGLIALTIGLTALVHKNLKVKFIFFSLSFLLIAQVSSRSALLCLMILVFLDAYWVNKYGFLNVKTKKARTLIAIFLFVICSFVFIDIANDLFELNDEYRGLGTGMSGRDIRWSAALEAWLLNPLIGVGFGESPEYLGFTADNAYLTILVELGLVGFIFYLIINFYSLSKSYRNDFKIGFIFLCVYLIYGFFEKRYFGVGNSFSILYLFYLFSAFNYKEKS